MYPYFYDMMPTCRCHTLYIIIIKGDNCRKEKSFKRGKKRRLCKKTKKKFKKMKKVEKVDAKQLDLNFFS
jgi:hypothetical protein